MKHAFVAYLIRGSLLFVNKPGPTILSDFYNSTVMYEKHSLS